MPAEEEKIVDKWRHSIQRGERQEIKGGVDGLGSHARTVRIIEALSGVGSEQDAILDIAENPYRIGRFCISSIIWRDHRKANACAGTGPRVAREPEKFAVAFRRFHADAHE
jgi:hypothetical protein